MPTSPGNADLDFVDPAGAPGSGAPGASSRRGRRTTRRALHLGPASSPLRTRMRDGAAKGDLRPRADRRRRRVPARQFSTCASARPSTAPCASLLPGKRSVTEQLDELAMHRHGHHRRRRSREEGLRLHHPAARGPRPAPSHLWRGSNWAKLDHCSAASSPAHHRPRRTVLLDQVGEQYSGMLYAEVCRAPSASWCGRARA